MPAMNACVQHYNKRLKKKKKALDNAKQQKIRNITADELMKGLRIKQLRKHKESLPFPTICVVFKACSPVIGFFVFLLFSCIL